MALVETEDLHAGYIEGSDVLEGVSLSVEEGTVTSLLGRNGVGKTTTLQTIVGLLEPSAGRVLFDGEDIAGDSPHEAYRRGLVLVPEDRRVFPELTVRENLDVPIAGSGERPIAELLDLFPGLRDRRDARGKHLSGGEKQMLTIARALRSDPRLLLLDEPTEGLAPQIVEDVVEMIRDVAAAGTTVLLVEQNVHVALELCSHHHVMDVGKVVYEGPTAELRDSPSVVNRYLGVS